MIKKIFKFSTLRMQLVGSVFLLITPAGLLMYIFHLEFSGFVVGLLALAAAWFGGDEAVRIAENLLLYQREIGGWVKNIDMALALGPTDRAAIEKQKADPEAHSTIDNDATYTQMRYLARVFTA